MDVAVVIVISILLAVVFEWFLVKTQEPENDQKRPFNYGNVALLFVITFGILFSIVNFRKTSEHNALKNIKVGDPPF